MKQTNKRWNEMTRNLTQSLVDRMSRPVNINSDLLCCWGLRESCVLLVNEEQLVGFRGRMGLEICEWLIN